jgi:hypothetical protein
MDAATRLHTDRRTLLGCGLLAFACPVDALAAEPPAVGAVRAVSGRAEAELEQQESVEEIPPEAAASVAVGRAVREARGTALMDGASALEKLAKDPAFMERTARNDPDDGFEATPEELAAQTARRALEDRRQAEAEEGAVV